MNGMVVERACSQVWTWKAAEGEGYSVRPAAHGRRLKERKRMSDTDLSKVISLQERLREYQYAPDSPPFLRKI